jgi:hypothetical protein
VLKKRKRERRAPKVSHEERDSIFIEEKHISTSILFRLSPFSLSSITPISNPFPNHFESFMTLLEQSLSIAIYMT